MKKLTLAVAVLCVAFMASCGDKKAADNAAAVSQEVVEQPVDTALMKSIAGVYKNADGAKVITLKADGTLDAKNISGDYFGWEVQGQSSPDAAAITLSRKGLENVVKDPAQVELTENKLIFKNEVFRRPEPKK